MTTIERWKSQLPTWARGVIAFLQMKNLLNYSMMGIRTGQTAEQCS